MDQKDIENKVLEILSGFLESDHAVTSETALLSEGVLNSLDFMNYLFTVEEAFHLRISEDDVENYQLGVMKNLTQYVSERIN